jgi:hypothetical protein
MLHNKKFQEAASIYPIKINIMEEDRKHPITKAEKMDTKFGPTVLLSIKESQYNFVKYLCRNGVDRSSLTKEFIKSQRVTLNLMYRGICEKTKSYILTIE